MRKKYFTAAVILGILSAAFILLAFYLPLHGAVLTVLFLGGVYTGFSAMMAAIHGLFKLNASDSFDLLYIIAEALTFFKS